ncbi:MAG: hypothetical protein ACYSO2_09650 [Planctomycetota bacterium]|jgi:hypothetical protein
MMNKQYNFLCQLMLLIALFMSFHVRAAVLIQVDPECTRSIQGVSDLDRKVYFSMSDRGTGFDDRCDDEIYDDLINELGVFFGRRLGVVKGIKGIEEDPERPGHANIELLRKHLSKRRYHPSAKFINDRGNNLDVAAHGNHNSYPKFMGILVKVNMPNTFRKISTPPLSLQRRFSNTGIPTSIGPPILNRSTNRIGDFSRAIILLTGT